MGHRTAYFLLILLLIGCLSDGQSLSKYLNNNSFLITSLQGKRTYRIKHEQRSHNRNDYVYTPNGTSVDVSYNDIDYSPAIIEANNHYYDNSYPYALLVGPSSQLYNCHSYAWYSQSIPNYIWMNDPSAYYLDGTYEEVQTCAVGDVICYFGINYAGVVENVHSGIVIEKLTGTSNGVCGDSDLVMVRSKWGPFGLYEHRGDQCPFASNPGGTFVKYYRPRTNETITLSNPTSGTQLIQRSNTILQNSDIEDSYAMYALNVSWVNNYGFEISSVNPLDVRLYDLHMQLVDVNFNTNCANGTYIVSFTENLTTGTYYLRVAYEDIIDYGTIYTNITNLHYHSYNDSYVWYDYTKHRSRCTCLSYVLDGHAVSSGAFHGGGQYATCLLCGGLASIGFVNPFNQNSLPTSSNGSFILSNGVIVLVDEDWEAYLNGTLVFTLPNID